MQIRDISNISIENKRSEKKIGSSLEANIEIKIKDKDIAEALQLPPIKLHCSVLAEEAIHKAIQNYDPMIGHNNPPVDK